MIGRASSTPEPGNPLFNYGGMCSFPGPVPKSNWLDCVLIRRLIFKFNIDIEQTGATKGLDCTLRTHPDVSHQSKFWTKYPKPVLYGRRHAPQNLPLIGGSVKILEKKSAQIVTKAGSV
jgi:hypothetical protein